MLIKNGTIIDGTKRARYKGDIRVVGDKIKEIGKLTARRKERVINAAGQFVAPGFVDMLNRSDIHFSIFTRPDLRSLVTQGITTIVGGNCGASLAPLAGGEAIHAIQKWHDVSGINTNWSRMGEFLAEVERHNLSVNFATVTGHATLRRGVVGDNFKGLRETEMKKIEYLLEQSLEEGSFGFSTGLAYSHEKIASTKEIERLTRVLKRKGGIYTTHLREEGVDLAVSVNEFIALARAQDIPSHISHFKAQGKKAWAEFPKSLDMVRNARASGIKVSFDIYPYTQTATVLYLLLPDWASFGGRAEVLNRLRDQNMRRKLTSELREREEEIGRVRIARGSIAPAFIDKTLAEIAQKQKKTAVDALLDVILASDDKVIGFIPALDEENVKIGMQNDSSVIASDGAGYGIRARSQGLLVHPRSFGAFPRFLGRYVGDFGVMDWETAIHKVSSLPAETLGLKKRGRLEKGYFADVVIFNPEAIRDQATFKDPFQYSEGVRYVLVNGGMALRKGKFQKKRWGRVLRK